MSVEKPANGEPIFTAQEEPGEIYRTATIKTIGDATTSSGKPYKVVEFVDGKKVRSFNPKQVEGLAPGMEVDYGLKKNERNGYWDLIGIKQAEARPDNGGEASASAAQSTSERGREHFLDDRERSIRSLNALTNATTLLAAMIQKDIVRPADPADACAMVGDLHRKFLKMYDPQPHDDGT